MNSPAAADTVLRAVSARSATDAWAVGATHQQPDAWGDASLSTPIIEHWNGTTWGVVAGPESQGELVDVAAISSDNAWAVGALDSSSVTGHGGAGGGALVEHWDGAAWALVTVPWSLALTAVSASASGDVWAVGNGINGASVIHLGVSGWSLVGSWRGALNDILARGPNNVWAVGQSSAQHPLALHWNGRRWRSYSWPLPSASAYPEGDKSGELSAIAGSTATNVWAVGDVQGESHWESSLFVLHWIGKKWLASPDPGVTNDYAEAIAVGAAPDVWVTSNTDGFFSHGGSGHLWRLNKRGWVTTTLRKNLVLTSIAPDARRGLWAVGFAGRGTVTDSIVGFPLHTTPLIERYGC